MASSNPPAAERRPFAARCRLMPDRLVLVVGLVGGLLLAFVTPPFQVPDEPAHFLHIYQLATGARLERRADGQLGVEMPASLKALVDLSLAELVGHPDRKLPPGLLGAAWRMPLAPESSAFVASSNVIPYTPIPYLPAAGAVGLGRLAGMRPLALLYLARLANLAAALALVWLAVRRAPILRWLFALLALTPMAIFERSSASADALTDALALLLVSLVLGFAVPAPTTTLAARAAGVGGHDQGQSRRALSLVAVAVLLACAKPVYFLLGGLAFLVPWSRLGSRRRAAAVWGGAGIAMAVGVGVSFAVARAFSTDRPLPAGAAPWAQLAGVMHAPLHFLKLAAGDYYHQLWFYLISFVGVFGWLDTPLGIEAVVAWLALLVLAAVTGGEPGVVFAAWQRALAAAVAAATLLALSLSQYVVWTPLAAPYIQGVQGRYFLPVVPILAVLLHNRRWAPAAPDEPAGPPWAGHLYGVASVALTLDTLLRIWFRYHGWEAP